MTYNALSFHIIKKGLTPNYPSVPVKYVTKRRYLYSIFLISILIGRSASSL